MKVKKEDLPDLLPCPECHYEPEMEVDSINGPNYVSYKAAVFCPNCQLNVESAECVQASLAMTNAAARWDSMIVEKTLMPAEPDHKLRPTVFIDEASTHKDEKVIDELMSYKTARLRPITRAEILDQAKRCVCGDREQDYGSPEDNFQTIADLWAVYIGRKCVSQGADVSILPEDVAAMLALLKIARITSGHAKADNWIDLAGYAACGGEIEAQRGE